MSPSKSSTNAKSEARDEVRGDAIAELKASLAQLASRVAQLEQEPAEWLPLKAAASDAGVEYERVRLWAKRKMIEARRDGGRWIVNVASLRARVMRYS